MPDVTITRLNTGATASAYAGKHPKAVIRTASRELVLPFAPQGAGIGGRAPTRSVVDRPGRTPLVVRDGDGLPTLEHEYLIGALDHQVSVEDVLEALIKISQDEERVTLANLSPLERGPWLIGDVGITGTLRQHGTNYITRATVSVSYLGASDAARLGPLTGGKKGGKGITKATTHVVKKGDTLRKLADRYYGEPDEWKRIAKANGIKNPDNLKVGRTLRIPADDKD